MMGREKSQMGAVTVAAELAVKVDEGLAPAIAELHVVFEHINRKFFVGKLPAPIITIQSQGRKQGVLGWCTTWAAWQKAKKEAAEENTTLEGRYEINLSAEHLHRPVLEILETLVHEVVHYANAHKGIKDCSGTQYHNKHFRALGEQLGLEVSQTAKQGWALTKLTPELAEWLESLQVNAEAFEFARRGMPSKPKAPTKMKLWQCDCTKIRAAVELDATCNKCGKPFAKQEKDDEA
jgi:hypothetical protein